MLQNSLKIRKNAKYRYDGMSNENKQKIKEHLKNIIE